MIIAITGGRRDVDRKVIVPSQCQMEQFFSLVTSLRISKLIHGKAIGTDQYLDRQVAEWAIKSGVGVEILPFPVQPDIDGPWPGAGHNRNRRMLVDSRAQVLVCFPGGKGTRNCRETGLELWFDRL